MTTFFSRNIFLFFSQDMFFQVGNAGYANKQPCLTKVHVLLSNKQKRDSQILLIRNI